VEQATNTAQAIHSQVNIVDVCEKLGVALKPSGSGELTGLCPIHDEDTPSFYVNPAKGLFHCFGCGAGGDEIALVQQTLGLSFKEAAQAIAEWFDIELDNSNVKRPVLASASELFSRGFKTGAEYLQERGISVSTSSLYGVGYASTGYADRLLAQGYTVDELEDVGLTSRGRETLAQRVIIPLRNPAGMVVGLSGRSTNGEMPKYMTTHRSQLFDKRRFLFGLDVARKWIKEAGEAIIVEGQIDAMSAYEAGVRNAVAIMGGNFTTSHAIAIKRAGAGRVIFVTDGDTAGFEAAKRGYSVATAVGLDAMAITLQQGSDPNSILASSGASALRGALTNPSHFGDFIVDVAALEAGDTTNIAATLAKHLANIHPYDPAYDRAINTAAERYGLDVNELRRYVRRTINTGQPPKRNTPSYHPLARYITAAIVACPTTGTVKALATDSTRKIVELVASTIPIEDGEPCKEAIRLARDIELYDKRQRLQRLRDQAKTASGDERDKIVEEMLSIAAEIASSREVDIC